MSMNINGYASANSSIYQSQQRHAGTGSKTDDQAATGSTSKTGGDIFSAASKDDYWEYLSENYDCVKKGKVSISPAYLRACTENPEKAKALEEELASYTECYNTVLNNIKKEGDTVKAFDLRYEIDSNGEVTVKGNVTVEASIGGKSMKELNEELEEKAAEKKEQEKLESEKEIQKSIEKEFIENMGKDDFNFVISIDVQVAKGEGSVSDTPAASTCSVDTVA